MHSNRVRAKFYLISFVLAYPWEELYSELCHYKSNFPSYEKVLKFSSESTIRAFTTPLKAMQATAEKNPEVLLRFFFFW